MFDERQLASLRERVRCLPHPDQHEESLTAAIIRQAVLDLMPSTAHRRGLGVDEQASARAFLIDSGLLEVLLRRQTAWPSLRVDALALARAEQMITGPVQPAFELEEIAA